MVGLALRVLLITGLLAEENVRKYAQESGIDTEVLALNVPVAAFLTAELIAEALREKNLDDFTEILVPGLVRGDVKLVSEVGGRDTFKGPRYAADLPTVLESLGRVELSTIAPACDLLKEELQQKALLELEAVEKNRIALLKTPGNMLIEELAVGKDFPMRIMAEIVDAPLLTDVEMEKLARKYVGFGAQIIDVGMIAGESRPMDAARAVRAVKRVVNVPVSIDTLNPDEAREAVSAGADLVLSVDAGNIEKMASFSKNVVVVVIPTNQSTGYFPGKVEERVAFLEETIARAKKLGMKKIIGDLVLEPSNVLRSMTAFREYAHRNPETPLFVGISNFTEMIDADSVGVNALLARLASEAGISILLATERSDKAKGSIREVATASKMMFLAKKRASVPKDLGLDLLVFKDKRFREVPYDRQNELGTQVVIAEEETKPVLCHEEGSFKIAIDRETKEIVAISFRSSKTLKPRIIVKGKTARAVYTKITEMGLVTRLDHSAYLGNELAKAEIAMKTGKEYIQDTSLFKSSLLGY